MFLFEATPVFMLAFQSNQWFKPVQPLCYHSSQSSLYVTIQASPAFVTIQASLAFMLPFMPVNKSSNIKMYSNFVIPSLVAIMIATN